MPARHYQRLERHLDHIGAGGGFNHDGYAAQSADQRYGSDDRGTAPASLPSTISR
jgi:hypothetical protein